MHLDLFQRIVVSPASVTVFAFGPHGVTMLKCNDTGALDELQPPPPAAEPPKAPQASPSGRIRTSPRRAGGAIDGSRTEHAEIELDDVDALGAGAVGEPGARAFYIQARTAATQLTVLVEKEQVALLATEAVAFLDRIADEYPEDPAILPADVAELHEPTVPLFRARLIGLGFDPERELVLHRAPRAIDRRRRRRGRRRERRRLDDDRRRRAGYVARIYATRPQVRGDGGARRGGRRAGRPPCPLCDMPMDPAGHRCPRWN